MQIRAVKIVNGWLHLPIGRDAKRYYVKFEVEGEQFTEFYLGLVAGEPDFWCGMELERYLGQTVTMTLDTQEPCDSELSEDLLEGDYGGRCDGWRSSALLWPVQRKAASTVPLFLEKRLAQRPKRSGF